MVNLSEIKRRIQSVRQTRQITGAMETISVAKMRKAIELSERNRAYFDTLCGLMTDIVSGSAELKELFPAPTAGKDALIVIASDRGLCGGFNHEVFKLADKLVTDNTVVMPVGRMAQSHFEGDVQTDDAFVSYSAEGDHGKAGAIAGYILDRYGNGIKSATIVYTRLISAAVQAPRELKLLPLAIDEEAHKSGNVYAGPELEPSPEAAIRTLVPMYISGLIYGAFVHSAASEHSARRAAMSSSTKNADDMLMSLTSELNRARQNAVTAQITEIIGSTKAIGEVDA